MVIRTLKVNMENTLLNYLFENFTSITSTSRTITLNHIVYYSMDFRELLENDILEKTELFVDYHRNYKTESSKKQLVQSLFNKVAIRIINKNEEIRKERLANSNVPECKLTKAYIPLLDIVTNTRSLFDPITGKVSNVCYDAVLGVMSKSEKLIFLDELRHVKNEYDPYNIKILNEIDFEGQPLMSVNRYMAPQWRFTPNIKSNCPKVIDKLLRHMFPTEESLEYILDWLFYCLVDRNEAYLVLNGAKGIGKGVFCALITALVGKDNSVEAPVGFLEGQFNSVLDQKRFILMDEFQVTSKNHAKLKRYINKFQNIEKKGMDANSSSETFNSFVISNNDESDMYLEHDDRRFSVPDITKKPLLKVMSEKEIQGLMRELEVEDSELIREFGYYIFNRGRNVELTYSVFTVFKGDKYYALVENSLKEWQKFLFNKIMDDEDGELNLVELRSEYSRVDARRKLPTNISKIKDFLKNYRHGGTKVLGEAVKKYNEWYIIRDADLLEPEDDNALL